MQADIVIFSVDRPEMKASITDCESKAHHLKLEFGPSEMHIYLSSKEIELLRDLTTAALQRDAEAVETSEV